MTFQKLKHAAQESCWPYDQLARQKKVMSTKRTNGVRNVN